MGTQLIAIAVLCAAIGIVIAWLTLPTPRPSAAARNAAGGAAAMTAGAGGATSPGESGKGDPAAADGAAKAGGTAG
jgi:hypothetical protein